MIKASWILLAVFLVLLASFTALAQADGTGTPTATIPMVQEGPRLTGDLSDPLWKSGALLTNFRSIEGGAPAAQQTTTYVLSDKSNLYLGVRCNEEHMDQLVTRVKEHDGEVWQDDSIEILIDTSHSHRTVYHLVANSRGTIADSRRIYGERSDDEWQSRCSVKTHRGTNDWTLEMAIPFSALGIRPVPGMVWGMNVCRERQVEPREFTSWAYTPGGFVQPQNFGHGTFGGKTNVKLLTWGNLDTDAFLGSENVLRCDVTNPGTKPMIASATLKSIVGGKVISTAKGSVSVPARDSRILEVRYKPSGSTKEVFHLSVGVNSTPVLSTTHPSSAIPARPRVWQLSDPLFESLLSKTPPGEQKNGAIYWFHDMNAPELRTFAKEYGLRYSLEESYRGLAESKFMPIMGTSMLRNPMLVPMAQKYSFKVLFQPDYRTSASKGVPVIDGLPFIFDPRSRQDYFDNLRDCVSKERQHIWGLYTQDEFHEKAVEQGLKFQRLKDSYPVISEIDERVEKEFGFGKYGLPDPAKDSDPFRWIAYRKWLNHEMLLWQKDAYEAVKQIAPEVQVVSIDPVAGHNPFGLDAIAPYVDIVTHQLYPSSNPNRQEFGFVTKFVADLTGKPVWPCTHVENYAYSVTPEETRELMSQVMRNGGKGFHLYIPDVRGGSADKGDTILTRYGCPERFMGIKEIVDTVSRMPEVAMPTDPDSAIFYSEDYYQSFRAANYVYPNEPEFAYTFLGPVARTWFKFVSDNMVAQGKANLNRYKAVFIPAAKYERPEVVRSLMEHVKSGGTAVCGDPEAFSWATDGTDLSDLHRQFFGSTTSVGVKQNMLLFGRKTPFRLLNGRKLPVVSPAFRLKLDDDTVVLATFPNGDPAVTMHRLGKGRVILFASNPFAEKAIADAGWKNCFRALAQELGLKMGRDIWRFRFPEYETVRLTDPDGVCATGNYVRWQQERMVDAKSITLPGTYTFAPAPDAIPDEGEGEAIPFASGNLTDRKKAPETSKSVLKPERFVVKWQKADPVAVTFDFSRPLGLKRLHLWYSDQLPDLSVEGSTDARAWSKLASHPRQSPTQDVLDVSLDLSGRGDYRYLRLLFGPRDPNQAMTLVECEVWASSEL